MSVSEIASRYDQTLFLDKPIETLRFVSGKRREALFDLGIFAVRDLLHHYPFRYDDFSEVKLIRDTPLGENVSILGHIDTIKVKKPRRNLSLLEVSVLDGSGVIFATWFNQPWLARSLVEGTLVLLLGKIEHSYGFKRMTNPLITIIENVDETDEDKTKDRKTKDRKTKNAASGVVTDSLILPVYHANARISNAWVARVVKTAVAQAPAILDPVPPITRLKLGLMSFQNAIKEIHQPSSKTARSKARKRLAFDEVFYLMLYLKQARRLQSTGLSPYIHEKQGPAVLRLPTILPFTLTDDQKKAIAEILDDMGNPKSMNRLLLGDVGSGKTIVAAHTLAAVFDTGTQAAMMAPTEVLAQQYVLALGPFFDNLGISWALLTSSTPPSERKKMLRRLSAGEICVLFGTHALIEPDVGFKNLSLIVIDEQHRFGVDQRAALRAKGPNCDALMMTATPIPRSLALVLYGDLAPTYLYTHHQSSTVTSRLLDRSCIGEAYEAIRTALASGHQAFVICPLITPQNASGSFDPQNGKDLDLDLDQSQDPSADGSDEQMTLIDLFTDYSAFENEGAIKAAQLEAGFLQKQVFPEYSVRLLTGRMSNDEKNSTMMDFRAGRIDVLVSTTVVEVGVDVPNATVMIVEDADRFGISQLHQLRGRIGRGQWDGEFFLVSATRFDETRERLRLLERITDGFELAEADLRLRREGDILGSRQHGREALKLIKVLEDADLIAAANEEADTILDADPELSLPKHALLANELNTRLSEVRLEENRCV